MQQHTQNSGIVSNPDHSRFLKLIDHFDLGVLKITANNQITDVNRSACRALKIEPDELIGKFFDDIFPENPELLERLIHSNGSDLPEKQLGELRKPGVPPIPVAYWISTCSESDPCEDMLFCFQPISGGKYNSRSVSAFSLEKLMASLIHEVRNPLGGIVGFSNLLEQDLTHLKYAHNMVLKIKQAAASLDKLITSLSIISRDKASVHLKTIVAQEYFLQIANNFQNELQLKNLSATVVKNFPQNELFVSINPFSFNILWEIILHHLVNIVQEYNNIDFEISQNSNMIDFSILINSIESKIDISKNFFRIPEIKQFLIEKILSEHQGTLNYSSSDKSLLQIKVQLPQFDFAGSF